VFYPPLATQAETQTLVAELKAKGFDSYIVQTAGDFKGYLSLGLFGREEGAQALVKRLKAAGYDKTKVDSRAEVVKVTTLSFRQLDEATAGKLKALQKRLLPGIPLQACR
jgi:cell division septation protein DedD